MTGLEQAIRSLELAHRELVGEYPADFVRVGGAVRGRSLAIDSLLELLKGSELTAAEMGRLQGIHLGGILSMERIRVVRQIIREELVDLSQQGRVLSGYQAGSITEP